ncbi:MAG: helix-turn-helix domain-containing protein [Myxococcota bacterium]
MPRKIPPGRFDAIVRAATEEFIARGYRRTQMSDVADAVGVSKATLYLYVESKESLFALCQRHADRRSEIALPRELPVAAPGPQETAEWVAKRIEQESVLPRLAEALERERADDIGAELRGVVAELYDVQERNCQAIKLMDRAADHPDVGPLWQRHGRVAPRRQLAEYMEKRMRAGQIRPHADPRLAARLLVETVATWAVHIKWDREPEAFEPASTRADVIEFIARGLEVR